MLLNGDNIWLYKIGVMKQTGVNSVQTWRRAKPFVWVVSRSSCGYALPPFEFGNRIEEKYWHESQVMTLGLLDLENSWQTFAGSVKSVIGKIEGIRGYGDGHWGKLDIKKFRCELSDHLSSSHVVGRYFFGDSGTTKQCPK